MCVCSLRSRSKNGENKEARGRDVCVEKKDFRVETEPVEGERVNE